DVITELLAQLQRALVDLAARHTETILPGFTHLQVAQPVSFAHHLLAYVDMFARDAERIADVRRRTNRLPLGAAALAGTSYALDRERLARSFGNALRPALRKRGLLATAVDPSLPRLHVCFVAGDHALPASADPATTAPWPLGVPRLKLHADAPSRSALKLDEALLCLLDDRQRDTLLRPGMTAADLGAAPGGWTWVLARHGLRVTAIDNGPLRPHVLDTGLVDHLRADGFRWQPSHPLDWMVCDMVEQPSRVARRMGEWFAEGWCRQSIFNLKLPMKKRWQETRLCLDLFRETAGRPLELRAKQLYHDREEITVFAAAR
ncbi:MAG TPA: 23S rRNA (cytidine(2498)-2'-O)-methyltransferase RlmM, partial [Luteimonas sp.]|nr:23S rRNA (cytidine(2498)-2'-O)-methyltransferase RlmM [Luteimonas sp.]